MFNIKSKKIKESIMSVCWGPLNQCCTISTDYGIATLVIYGDSDYMITRFQIDSPMLRKGKGKELMGIIVEAASSKGAHFLYVVPQYDYCKDGKELIDVIQGVDPQKYVENRYKSYGFKDYKSDFDGSSHHLYRMQL